MLVWSTTLRVRLHIIRISSMVTHSVSHVGHHLEERTPVPAPDPVSMDSLSAPGWDTAGSKDVEDWAYSGFGFGRCFGRVSITGSRPWVGQSGASPCMTWRSVTPTAGAGRIRELQRPADTGIGPNCPVVIGDCQRYCYDTSIVGDCGVVPRAESVIPG